MDTIEALRREIEEKEAELVQLRARLVEAEKLGVGSDRDGVEGEWKWPLKERDYERYSRQMIVPNFGLQGIHLFIHFLKTQMNDILTRRSIRPAEYQACQGPPRRRWWPRMSRGGISRWCWCWDAGSRGWRCG